ncbi:putative transcriptional regulatory protein [Vanrija pseudolonga]|uniref:Purtative transcriptional regulatory protein n=1 Tax=Vanrija pseudolonga TaxID=143232 RepID=A0AAF0YA84_9TREE|nr:purtative transcriptional regulatory protein [Vanrija pseudolonga]
MPAVRESSAAAEAHEANGTPAPRPGKNCAECRRLKVKCDRKIPCSACVRRGCAAMCPGESFPIKELFSERQTLLDKVKDLEALVKELSRREVRRSPPPSALDGLGLLGAAGARASFEARRSEGEEAADMLRNEQRRVQLESPHDDVEVDEELGDRVKNSGTLVVSGGRSRYLGGSAMPLWLSEPQGGGDVADTRPPSPTRSQSPNHPFHTDPSSSSIFGVPSTRRYAQAVAELPSKDEGWILVESNYRHLAWNGSALSRDEFAVIYDSVYANLNTDPKGFTDTCLAFQRIAMVYIVLALGTLVSLELPLDDPTGKFYFDMARQCLVNGRFLTLTTLIGVQTTSLMARYCSYAGMRSGTDLAWQMRGLAMRLVLSMGLHRDGQSWNLSEEDLNNRRKVFWEAFSHDVFLSRCWDRPTGIAANQYDTKFPDDYYIPASNYFELHRCKLSILVKRALDESLQVQPSPYSHVVEIWQSIVKAEAEVPFNLRCRATARAMVSRYTTQLAADAATPEPSRKDLKLTFQQHSLTLDYCAAVFLLLRPYFVHALYTFPEDPTHSPYADAYLAVIERSSMMIAMLRSIHSLFPLLSTRHWQFWSHAFSSAVCMATVCAVSPTSPLVTLAMAELESVINLLQSILSSLPHRELRKNLDWLLRLRERAKAKTLAARNAAANHESGSTEGEPDGPAAKDPEEHLMLVGWRTRLIELGEGRPQVNIVAMPPVELPPPPADLQPDAMLPMVSGLDTQPPIWVDMISSTSRQPLGDTGEIVQQEGISPDFLQQLLGAPVGQPFPIDVWPETNTDDFNQIVFDLQNFLG